VARQSPAARRAISLDCLPIHTLTLLAKERQFIRVARRSGRRNAAGVVIVKSKAHSTALTERRALRFLFAAFMTACLFIVLLGER
jgi:hypothetical protein